MLHTKTYIMSQGVDRAIDYLYKEIEDLERKVRNLEDEIEDLRE